MAVGSARMAFPWRALLVMIIGLTPSALLGFLLANPGRNVDLNIPLEHFVIATNVSAVALTVGFLVARSALQLRSGASLLLAVGFICMAAIFLVHGLSTPGVLQRSGREGDAGLVVGVSAQLALWTAAVCFAARFTPVAAALGRSRSARWFLVALVAELIAYAVLALGWPSAFGGLARLMLVSGGGSYSYDYDGAGPLNIRWAAEGWVPFAIVISTVALLGFATYRQAGEFARGRLPFQGALALSFILLAQAQISQFLAPVWTLAWWEYHGLMLAAVVLALGALFVELDRRRGLERFLPPNVVSRVIAGDVLHLKGERAVVTILFTDLRGSTALAERLQPEEIVDVLNAYLRTMATCVIAEGGILDKFLGDGLMAIFGALGDDRAGALGAARAALAMRLAVADLSRAREGRGEPTVAFGIGIHTGDVVLGAVGLPERSDYTAIGDAVNTAARMESLTKELGVDAVLSSDTASRLAGSDVHLRSLGEVSVKGKAQPLTVFSFAA